jgi:hypothetical protein
MLHCHHYHQHQNVVAAASLSPSAPPPPPFSNLAQLPASAVEDTSMGDYENLDDMIVAHTSDARTEENAHLLSCLPTLRAEDSHRLTVGDDVTVVDEERVRCWQRAGKIGRGGGATAREWKLGAWEAGEGRLHSGRPPTRHGLILLGS